LGHFAVDPPRRSQTQTTGGEAEAYEEVALAVPLSPRSTTGSLDLPRFFGHLAWGRVVCTSLSRREAVVACGTRTPRHHTTPPGLHSGGSWWVSRVPQFVV